MAPKVVRTNKAKGIKAKSKKEDKFAKLKLLSKYMVSGGNQRLLDALMQTDKQTLRNMKYRTISQLVTYPKIISYINKYMNSLYDFSNIPPEEWFYSIMFICRIHELRHTNDLYFSKFQQNDRDVFIKTINDYHSEIGADKPNKAELNALFILYKFGALSEEILITMKEIISGKPSGAKSTVAQQNQFNIQQELLGQVAAGEKPKFEIRNFNSLSPDIQQYVNNISTYLSTRNVCKQCEMNCRQAVTIDTNATTVQPIDLLFIGFMPSASDIDKQLPFSGGDSAKLFHRFLQPLAEKFGLKYLLTNFIFCPLDKTKQLQNKRKVVKNCGQLLDEIIRQFPPKMKVAVGLEATKIAGLKGGITKLNGKMIDDVFVLMDAEAVIINNKKLKQYEAGWIALEQFIQENSSSMQTTVEVDSFNIPEHQLITQLTNDLTFFDSRVIKDKIIMIMLDRQGTKKYFVQPISVPIYVKNGSYGECINFSDKMDGVIHCSEQDRQLLNSKLYREINKCEGL